MKILKNILYILAICLIALSIGYLAFSFTQFKDKGIDQDFYLESVYRTKNNDSAISFGNFENSIIRVDDVIYRISQVKYEKGMFELLDSVSQESYYFGIVDKNTLYSSSFNRYYYNIDLF